MSQIETEPNYNRDDIFIDIEHPFMQNQKSKLFVTFFDEENLNEVIKEITSRYTVLFNKIFILEVEGKNQLIATYNIDTINLSEKVLPNTILLHRKKETNSLYSINSLNALIKELNEGKSDSRFEIPWEDYQNSILLVSDGKLNKYSTKIHSIINV